MTEAWTDLYWLPLGAGGHCVRLNGRVYERVVAAGQRRHPDDLYHSAMQIHLEGTTYAVEMGPVWNVSAPWRGVVCEGPVGARWLGRFRAFRYEVRCWADGCIPDLDEAVGAPERVSDDPAQVAAVLRVLREVPPLTWGRDELGTGDMWNSNSLVSWALARTAHDMRGIAPPQNGRAPGWRAGLVLADRQGAFPVPAVVTMGGHHDVNNHAPSPPTPAHRSGGRLRDRHRHR
jgi:hypothetical protein